MKGLVGNLLTPRQIGKRNSVASPIYKPSHAPIGGLLASGSPPAISRFIIPINVYAIKRRPLRARPHVTQECGKIVSPLNAHPNPAPTIKRIFGIVRIFASGLRVIARAQLWAGFVAPSVTVTKGAVGGHLLVKATTTLRESATNTIKLRLNVVSAVTHEQPKSASPSIRRALNRDQTTISVVADV